MSPARRRAGDPDASALRRPDSTVVDRVGARGMAHEALEREALEDLLGAIDPLTPSWKAPYENSRGSTFHAVGYSPECECRSAPSARAFGLGQGAVVEQRCQHPSHDRPKDVKPHAT